MGRSVAKFDPRDTTRLGPAMARLTVRQRAFVDALLINGGKNFQRAAVAAGYSQESPGGLAVMACRLAHDQRILDAMREETERRLHSGQLLASSVLLEVAENSNDEKVRVKAALAILDRTGHSAVNVSQITHKSVLPEEEMLARIKHLADVMGLDAKKLIGNARVIEGKAEEVISSTEGLEDVL